MSWRNAPRLGGWRGGARLRPAAPCLGGPPRPHLVDTHPSPGVSPVLPPSAEGELVLLMLRRLRLEAEPLTTRRASDPHVWAQAPGREAAPLQPAGGALPCGLCSACFHRSTWLTLHVGLRARVPITRCDRPSSGVGWGTPHTHLRSAPAGLPKPGSSLH